jgi:hypothetical protein
VLGGTGDDTLVASGFAFSDSQRLSIFTQSSIETIIDNTGTYTVPAVDKLTAGTDLVLASSDNQLVTGTSSTLTAGDDLAGGDGFDELFLSGGGSLDLSSLAGFSGFEQVTWANNSNQPGSLILRDGIDLDVLVTSDWGGYISLGNGTTHLELEGYGNFQVSATRGGDTTVDFGAGYYGTVVLGSGHATINGGTGYDRDVTLGSGIADLDLSENGSVYIGSNAVSDITLEDNFGGSTSGHNYFYLAAAGTYDLDNFNLSGKRWNFQLSSATTLELDQDDLDDVANIYDGKIQTAEATLDLSHIGLNATVISSNTDGTTFTVDQAAKGLQVLGGTGDDTLVASGFAFSDSQRLSIFTQSSIETIIDNTGTYDNPFLMM